MAELTVPTSPIQSAGRAAEIRVQPGNLGGYVANFGEKLAQAGDIIQAGEDQHELARAKVDITRDMGEMNLKYQNMSDPAAIDQGWATDMAALRGQYKEKISARNWGKVDLAMEDLGNRYALSLGQRAIDLRVDRGRATLDDYAAETYRAAATADDGTRADLMGNLSDAYAEAVANNLMSEEDAAANLRTFGENVDRATARRMLTDDPQALLDKLDKDGFPGMDPQARETVRDQALSAISATAAANQKERDRLAKEREKAIGDDLDVIIHNAGKGRNTGFEMDVMTDPEAQANPKYREALEAVNLRNTMPEFASMTPAEMDAAIAAEEKRPLTRADETKRLDAMKAARTAAGEAWDKDPYAQAEQVFGNPPPTLPDFNAGAPDDFVQGLKARRNYAASLHDAGYTAGVEYFSNAEKEALKQQAAVENDPRDRLALAASLTQALGPDAGAAIAQIGGDPLFEHAGGMIAAGGDPETARRILQGQQALANKTVALPVSNARLDVLYSEFHTLFDGNDAAEARLRDAADAIYATEARGLDPTAEDSNAKAYQVYARALHLAMGGGYDKNGDPVGGVGEVQGGLTVLPVGVSAATVEAGLDRQAAAIRGKNSFWSINPPPVTATDGGTKAWLNASRSGGVPHYAGAPVDPDQVGELKLKAVGNDLYQLYVEPRPGYRYDITDSETPNEPYRFSLRSFLKEALQ